MTLPALIELGASPLAVIVALSQPGATLTADFAQFMASLAAAAVAASAAVAIWLRQSYTHAPALMLGLAALLAVPLLAILGHVLRRRSFATATRAAMPAPQPAEGAEAAQSDASDGYTWPVDATIEIEGKAGARIPIGRELMRIGREVDNDLVLANQSVHRFHAVIQRTEDSEIIVVDMSSSEGNGVVVNGKRVPRARLRDGDLIELGESRLRFASRRA